MSIFSSEDVITEHISNADLKTYFVGYDFGRYRCDELVEKIIDAIVDFSFGFHEGILQTYTRSQIIKAAKQVYKIEEYDASNPEHNKLNKKGERLYNDADEFIEKKYLNRGEFGEVILHLLLRDFINTVPLISKIYLKDSYGVTVKGLDAVHVGPSIKNPHEQSLYLGESKLHRTGESGVKELIKDIEDHFNSDFLMGEFVLIGNKKRAFLPLDEYIDLNTKNEYEEFLKQKTYWYEQLDNLQNGKGKLQDIFQRITIPLLCTYTSKVFENHTDETTDEFRKEYEEEMNGLKILFDTELVKLKSKATLGQPISTNLDIVLMLFPVPSKKELVKKLHTKLHHQQRA